MRPLFRLCAPGEAPPVRATPEDLQDAARLGPNRGAERLIRRRWLRAAAAEALGVHPDRLRIDRSARGRPVVVSPTSLYASASSSAGWTAVAVGSGPVGVDVEALPPRVPPPLDLLLASERDWLGSQPTDERDAAFLGLWTAREALAKALEIGMDAALMDWRAVMEGEAVRLTDGSRTETARLIQVAGAVAAIVEPAAGD